MKEQLTLFQAIAEVFNMDEADVIDNNDGETVTVFDVMYQYIEFEQPITLGNETYNWAMFEVSP